MSQVIMIFLFPIGLYFYFFVEKKERVKNQKIFDDFKESIKSNTKLSSSEKKELYIQMLEHNDYIITSSENTVLGEKKLFSMSLLAMGAGLYMVGMVFYLLYYYWVQKPHIVEYRF